MLGTQEQRTEGMKRQAQELIEQAYNRGFKAGKEEGFYDCKRTIDENALIEQAYQRGYKAGYDKAFATLNENWQLVTSEAEEKGRNEAWEVAKKISKTESYKLYDIFAEGWFFNILNKFSASEVIEKFRTYEEQNKQEDDEIHVGDEVTDCNGIKGVVVGSFKNSVDGNKFISILGAGEDFEVPQIMPREDYKKTGRHFPEIAEVLKKMKEGEE